MQSSALKKMYHLECASKQKSLNIKIKAEINKIIQNKVEWVEL